MKVRFAVVFLMAVTSIICLLAVPSFAENVPRALGDIDLSSTQPIDESEAMNIRGEGWSPNNFPKGQCTWYVDGRWKEYHGFKLEFARKGNGEGNAQNWIRNVKSSWRVGNKTIKIGKGNANFTGNYAGEIMVLKTGQYGHVAFVESSQANRQGGQKWKVSHMNWPLGSGKSYTTFNRVNSNYVRENGRRSSIQLLGFIYKK